MASLCSVCRLERPLAPCIHCEAQACKRCVEFLSENRLEHLPEGQSRPKDGRYCTRCFDETVSSIVENYDQTLEQAKAIPVIPKTYRTRLSVARRSKEIHRAGPLPDKRQVFLRLAYLAVQEGYNALIEAEVSNEKLRNHGYQTHQWRGSAVLAEIDVARLNRDEIREDLLG